MAEATQTPPVVTQEPTSTVQPAATPVASEPVRQEPTAPTTTQPVVSDRTAEQFEKLKESNKKLFDANRLLQEELAKRARSEQTFAPIQQTPPPTVPQPSIEQFVTTDPTTGEQYVDQNKLVAALQEANTKATQAQSAVANYIRNQQALDEEKQTREAFDAHPEVNPTSDKFDASISKKTRALLIDSMMNPQDYGGHALTFKEAADEAKKQTPEQAQTLETKTQNVQQAMEGKEQATAGVTGVSSAVAQQISTGGPEEANVLVDKTRRGRGDESTWAIAQRLSKVQHTGTPTSSTQT